MIARRWLCVGLAAALIIGLALWQLQPGWRSGRIDLGAPPPRAAATRISVPPVSSIALPVRLPLSFLARAINDAVPAQLWAIDEPGRVCVPATRLKLFKSDVKITPDIECRIVGDVVRGPIRLTGRGPLIHLEMPLSAVVQARDIGGIISHETATAAALVTAELRPALTADGRLTARIHLAYDWQQEPGVTLMGQRIRFTEKIDRKLAPVLAKAEIALTRTLANSAIKDQIDDLWRQGFTVESLNRHNPTAWLRLTPMGLRVGTIYVEGDQLHIDAVLTAIAEVALGPAPPRPHPTLLPAITRAKGGRGGGLVLHTAVLSDYATLEPVIAKALAKLSARGITVPQIGRVKVSFGRPTLYATGSDRLALGLDIAARGPYQLLDTRGRVWLTARAETAPGSERVLIRDLRLVADHAEGMQLPLLLAVAVADPVRLALEQALTQDFGHDYSKLMAKIDKKLTAVKIGDFTLGGELRDVRHGKILALGQGLYLPVEARGSARIDYAAPR